MSRHSKGFLDALLEAMLGFLWQRNPPPRNRPASFRRPEPFRFAKQDDEEEAAVPAEVWRPSLEWCPPVVRDLIADAPSRDILAELRDEAVHIAQKALDRRRRGEIVTASELAFVQDAIEKLTRGHREVPLVLIAFIEM